ncbi:MAG: helix-turn-helix transcriptional regulator [Desulfobaccales bacterium]
MPTRLRRERTQRGLTQAGVAHLTTLAGTPISQVRLSMLERGLNPKPAEAEALAEIFGVRPDELFER